MVIKKLKYFLVALFVSLECISQASVVSLYSGDLTFDISDEYIEIPISNNANVVYYAASGDKAMAVYALRTGNFSIPKVLAGLDSCLCDLSKYQLVDIKEEPIWDLTTDYVTRKYVSEGGLKFVSHIRYVTKGAYCFGFWYNSDEELKDFETTIKSIHFAEENGMGQIKLVWKYNILACGFILPLLFVFMGVIMLLIFRKKNNGWSTRFIFALRSTIVMALILIVPMWHFWVAYSSLLLLFFILCFYWAGGDASGSNNSSGNNTDVDTDVDIDIDFG